ncbi:hypothetical protein FIBSPDRAFT_249891 [Athelia psychrophila]|uniref:Uncharacterized protein n=1 Tax=Athelia psychrophila TaxID=1759441 RepID=A0A165XWG9_9AGAM|nr:hypothetical protein FIBSPDRAFT_249891 [Fibularhizoctonia sp. CBS 109695]
MRIEGRLMDQSRGDCHHPCQNQWRKGITVVVGRPLIPFTAAATRSSQPLFTPFVVPLDENEKKSIRRVALLDAPNFHLGQHRDAAWIISASNRSQEQMQARANTHKSLREIVKKEVEL